MSLSQLCAHLRDRFVDRIQSDRRASPRGQALVEFALVLPLLLVLMLAVLDFGRMMAVNSAAVTASREAARYGAAVGDNGSGTPRYVDCPGMRDAARDATDALITLSNAQIQIGYDDGTGTARTANCNGGSNPAPTAITNLDRVVVQVTLTYEPATPVIGAMVGPITVQSVDRRTIVKDVP